MLVVEEELWCRCLHFEIKPICEHLKILCVYVRYHGQDTIPQDTVSLDVVHTAVIVLTCQGFAHTPCILCSSSTQHSNH